MGSESDVPHFRVERRPAEPQVVKGAGTTGLAKLVAVIPAPDSAACFEMARVNKDVIIRQLFKAAQEAALVLEVSVHGNDEEARANLEQTIDNMDLIINAWEQPEEFLKFMYFREANQE